MMEEAILILNIIILVVVCLMVPIVTAMSQNLDDRKADSRKIREMHDYIYELKRRDLVQEHEENLAKELKEFNEWVEYDESDYLTRHPNFGLRALANYDEEDDGHDAHVYARQVNQRKEQYEEQHSFLIEQARDALYKLDCEKHNYLGFSEGTNLKWPDGEGNSGYSADWRFQRADGSAHESFDYK